MAAQAADLVPRVALSSGAGMPQSGLGCWRSPPGEVETAVAAALDQGTRHLDCAAIYGNEAAIGGVLAAKLQPSGPLPREELFVTSKLWNTEHAPDRVRPACLRTLEDLQLKYLDLYLIHWPFVTYDHGIEREEGMEEVHFTETWRIMEALVEEGLVRSIGLSNFNSSQVREILTLPGLKIRPAVLQVECHPYLAQTRLLSFCQAEKIAFTAFCPLANPAAPEGMRMFGCEGGWRDKSVMEEPVVLEIARAHGRSAAQVVLRWNVQRGVIVIPKTKSPARLLENAAIFDFVLSEAEMAGIDKLDAGLRVCGYSGMMDHPLHPWGRPAQAAGVEF